MGLPTQDLTRGGLEKFRGFQLIGRSARRGRRQIGHRLMLMRSSRLLTTAARPPAVFFVLVNPKTTQKPMNSASTNTVLAPSP